MIKKKYGETEIMSVLYRPLQKAKKKKGRVPISLVLQNRVEKNPQMMCKVSSLRNYFGLTLVSHFLLTFYSLLYLTTINIYIA